MARETILRAEGWTHGNRKKLEQWIRAGAGRGLPVTFDFDNSIVSGDIGEATLAWLVRSGRLAADRLSAAACPPLVLADGRKVSLETVVDTTEYYELSLTPTVHGAADPRPMATGYLWAVEVMAGLRLVDVVRATRTVMKRAGTAARALEVTPGKTAYALPRFYEPIVELIAALLRHGYEVWVVSASNVWSVRSLVLEHLNPRLRELGVEAGIPPHRVRGVATLLTDRRGRWYKDEVLTLENPDYAALREPALRAYRLTRHLQHPASAYSGKVATIWDCLGRRPYLAVGDSPGDHAMLSFSEHRLWIARLEKPDYQEATVKLVRQTGERDWIAQPVLSRGTPGFVSDLSRLDKWLPEPSPKVARSIEAWGKLLIA